MGRFYYTVLFLFGFTAFGFTQAEREVAVVKNHQQLGHSKVSGEYTFILPEGITKKDVTHSANYYTHYFTVEFDESSRETRIKLIDNTEKSRHVIVRFLVSCGVQKVTSNGDSLAVDEFYSIHMK
jgi:hypothetical protein